MIIRFVVSKKSKKTMLKILLVALILGVSSILIGIIVGNTKPTYTDVPFSLDDREKQFFEVTLQEGESIYFKVASDEHLDIRIMTKEEYVDMTNGGVFSYVEDYYRAELDTQTDPLEAGIYVFYLEGDTHHSEGILSYAIATDISGQMNLWIGLGAIMFLAGLFVFLTYGFYADNKFRKKGK
ncbi:MAG: hypothetical protein E4G98_04325 [Promethearchaeota archaeon]|nr:MAG: hypothetical protein E4G98_04325 [Candidatus Lokiarchaeota archaeon]